MEGATTVPSGYVEVSLVQAVGFGTHADLEHAVDGLRVQAVELGCEAVVNVRVDRSGSQISALGVAIRWPNGIPQTPVAPPPTPSIVAPWATPSRTPSP
jgi:hypothetical protein